MLYVAISVILSVTAPPPGRVAAVEAAPQALKHPG